jgi:serine/threonine protein phosphatase PrpC
METVFKTDSGKIRSHNEDSGAVFHNDKGQILAVVADGMGGHRAGDVASSLTLKYFQERWETAEDDFTEESAAEWIRQTVEGVNQQLLSYTEDHPECRGMGTTVVLVLCTVDFIIVAHVGDSRCYVLKNETFEQLTEDHSLVTELVRQGQITEDEAVFHPRKHVLLKALGTEEHIEAEIDTFHWQVEDLLLLCSDGLTNKVSDESLEGVLRSDATLETRADQLIEMANEAGGEDNISLALVRFETKDEKKQSG